MIKKYTSFILLSTSFLYLMACTTKQKPYKPIKFSIQEENKNLAPTEQRQQPEPVYSEKYMLYEVLVTDTIASVARKHHISAETIINYNSIKKPYILKPGQMLKIPQVSNREDDLIDSLDALDKNGKKSKLIQIAPKEQ